MNTENVHLTFTCPHCGTGNELTATDLHDATVIHCSHCRVPVGPVRRLRDKPLCGAFPELAAA